MHFELNGQTYEYVDSDDSFMPELRDVERWAMANASDGESPGTVAAVAGQIAISVCRVTKQPIREWLDTATGKQVISAHDQIQTQLIAAAEAEAAEAAQVMSPTDAASEPSSPRPEDQSSSFSVSSGGYPPSSGTASIPVILNG